MLKLSEYIRQINYIYGFRERNGEDCSILKDNIIIGVDMVVRSILNTNEYDLWVNETILDDLINYKNTLKKLIREYKINKLI